VDLNQLTKDFVDAEYHPDQFPGLAFGPKAPKTATPIFSSGKLACTGAKREGGVYMAANNLHVLLEEKDMMVCLRTSAC
jgi:transcription initiation factor TFIID TATA-box-binding protein